MFDLKEHTMNRLLFMGCTAYLLVGLAHVIIGSLLTELLAHYHLHYSNGGQLIFTQFSGFLLGVLLVPWMTAKLSKRTTLTMMLTGLGLAQMAYGFLPPWPFMYVIGFIAGAGFGSIEAIVGTLIIESIHEKKAKAMSRLEVFFGVGALIMPVIAGWMIYIGYWHLSFFIIGAASLLLALGFKLLPFGQAEAHLSRKITKTTKAATPLRYNNNEKYILLFCILFFLIYVGSEMSLVNFLPSFLIDKLHLDSVSATNSVTYFWLTMAIGRVFTGVIADKVNHAVFLLWSTFGAVIFTVLFTFAFNSWTAFAVVLLIGLFMSGIFAISLIYANHLLPGKPATTSILIASGGIGGALIPLVIGWLMDHYSVSAAVLFIISGTVILLIMSFIAYRMRGNAVVHNTGK
jgi:FHS family glucose/mannose:H+ symporter-like MFS transporter